MTVSERANIPPNPSVVGRPLTGASAALFVGREDVFAWLAENLAAGGPPNALLLYGERRIGKTSTLYQLVEGELVFAQILLLLGQSPLSTGQISEKLGLSSSAVAKQMKSFLSRGLVRYDQERGSYALARMEA